MKTTRKILVRMLLASFVLGTPRIVLAHDHSGGESNPSSGNSVGQYVGTIVDAATSLLQSGACDGLMNPPPPPPGE